MMTAILLRGRSWWRPRRLTRSTFWLPGVVLLALLLTWLRAPLVSSQGLTLVAAHVAGDLPLTDPLDERWQAATALVVPLSAQMIARPVLPEARVKAVTVRALHNETQLALALEWADDTQNDQSVRVQDFRDGAAVQFPLAAGLPFYCMGQQGGDVNIWHWKADWQAAIIAQQTAPENTDDQGGVRLLATYPNFYVDQYPFTASSTDAADNVILASYADVNYLPSRAAGNLMASAVHASPVEDLMAGGFGSLTSQAPAAQNVQGYGAWENGRWRVIFYRDLLSPEGTDVSFTLDQPYSVAFAAWDGANGERNGEKSTSQWVTLQLASAPAAAETAPATAATAPVRTITGFSILMLTGLLTLLLLLIGAVFLYFRLPEGN